MAALDGTTVGIVGVGTMGSAMATSLVEEGAGVVGFDVSAERRAVLAELGGETASSPGEVLASVDFTILSLPSSEALREVVGGSGGLLGSGQPGSICIETSTLPLRDKKWAEEKLGANGIVLLDCPISGTGSQARQRDIVFYTSGPSGAVEAAQRVLTAIGRGAPRVGEFGAGSVMKYVANLLVTVHTVAAGEAFALARKAGMDPQATYDLLIDGSGSSRMLEVRGPMMVERSYPGDSATVTILSKDVDIITDFAAEVDVPTPLLALSRVLLRSARAQGWEGREPAVVAEVLSGLAGDRHLEENP